METPGFGSQSNQTSKNSGPKNEENIEWVVEIKCYISCLGKSCSTGDYRFLSVKFSHFVFSDIVAGHQVEGNSVILWICMSAVSDKALKAYYSYKI